MVQRMLEQIAYWPCLSGVMERALAMQDEGSPQ